MRTKAFWIDSAERAARTAAQSVIALWGVGITGILDVDPVQTASVAGLAAALSLLMSVAASGVGDKGTASFIEET